MDREIVSSCCPLPVNDSYCSASGSNCRTSDDRSNPSNCRTSDDRYNSITSNCRTTSDNPSNCRCNGLHLLDKPYFFGYILSKISNQYYPSGKVIQFRKVEQETEIIDFLFNNCIDTEFKLSGDKNSIVSVCDDVSSLVARIRDSGVIPGETREDKIEFIRGYWDHNGIIVSDKHAIVAIKGPDNLLASINNFINIPCSKTKEKITYFDINGIDFLHFIYQNFDRKRSLLEGNYEKSKEILNKFGRFEECGFSLSLPGAVAPSKGRYSDVGFDLTIIKEASRISEKTRLYDTGVKVNPPLGYYTEIVPRSSLSKTGYILSNSVGVIDPSYRGTLKIALTRIDDSLPEITLPLKVAQLIFKRYEGNITMKETDFIASTSRGEGGFGSTDK